MTDQKEWRVQAKLEANVESESSLRIHYTEEVKEESCTVVLGDRRQNRLTLLENVFDEAPKIFLLYIIVVSGTII